MDTRDRRTDVEAGHKMKQFGSLKVILITLIAIETGPSITGTVLPLSTAESLKQTHSHHKNNIVIINHTDEWTEIPTRASPPVRPEQKRAAGRRTVSILTTAPNHDNKKEHLRIIIRVVDKLLRL